MAVAQEYGVGLEALAALGHGVCLVDAQKQVLYWNPQLEQWGVPGGQVEGRPLAAVMASLELETAKAEEMNAAVDGVLAGAPPQVITGIDLNFPSPTDPVYRVTVAGIPGGVPVAALIFQDVSETMRTREQFDRILESTQDGIFVIDTNKQVRVFNRACGEITGRNPMEVLRAGCACNEVVHCHTEAGESYATSLCPAKSVFRGEASYQREEMMLTNAAGEERWIETTYSPIRNARGEVEYVIGILRDVHGRKVLEERLSQTEKLASFGQVLAGIAHEIKNPLAIILSSLDVLENASRPTEQRKEAGQFIREEVKRLDERLRSFLAFARPRALRPRPLLLSGVAERRIASMQAVFPEVSFVVEKGPSDAIIMGDEEQLTQVITNLILNAGEAMDGRGTITVRTRLQAEGALLEIEDDGPGVPADLQARIFDPFFTTKAEGTGLGLSICYQIVLAHRGTISIVHGKHGRGACFVIRLPTATRFRE